MTKPNQPNMNLNSTCKGTKPIVKIEVYEVL